MERRPLGLEERAKVVVTRGEDFTEDLLGHAKDLKLYTNFIQSGKPLKGGICSSLSF